MITNHANTNTLTEEMTDKKTDLSPAVEIPSSFSPTANGAAAAASGNDAIGAVAAATAGVSVAASSASANDAESSSLVGGAAEVLPSFVQSLTALSMPPAVFAAAATASTFITVALISHVKSNPAFYTQTTQDAPAALSAGQIMAFLVCFFAVVLYLAVQITVLKEYFFGGKGNNIIGNSGDGNGGTSVAAVSTYSEHVLARRRVVADEKYDALLSAFQFTSCLLLFFLLDRTTVLERGKKHYNRDEFFFIYLVFVLVGLGTLKKAAKPRSRKEAAPKPAAPEQAAAVAVETGVSAGASPQSSSTAASVPIPATTAVVTTSAANGSPSAASSSSGEDTFEIYHVAHLQRDQTEEWKGWMQVMFLFYHYFSAGKDIYSAIRLFIAAYVWMTGFGNFSYYYMRKDFSFLRFMSMQWRLNFLVFFVCLIMQNEYMLYYICMLHTTFTVFIYIALGIKSELNFTFYGCCAKFAIVTVISLLIWDVSDDVFDMVWAPLKPLVQFHTPYKSAKNPDKAPDVMHEWRFRSKLDHLIWIFGMICAFNHPTWDGLLKRLDALPALTGGAIKAAVVAVCLFVANMYYERVYALPKEAYNALHPYTSFIPIFIFIVLRNISQVARMYHVHMFEWLGKITLETYIAQYHVWMATTGINGSPKKLLEIIPGMKIKEYPLLTFLAASGLCLFVSHRLFNSTLGLKAHFLPSSMLPEQAKRTTVVLAVWLAGLYVASWALYVATSAPKSSY